MNSTAIRNIQVGGGDCLVSRNELDLFCTVLGSCIAACIYDPIAGIGGMNHYLLPYGRDELANARYGDEALPLLLEQVCRAGGVRHRLEAKLYGGARTLVCDTDIGQMNIALAHRFFEFNRIAIVDTDLGGRSARWIKFHPASGHSIIRVASDSLSFADGMQRLN